MQITKYYVIHMYNKLVAASILNMQQINIFLSTYSDADRMCYTEPVSQSKTVNIIVTDSFREVIFGCCARFHPPAGSSPRIEFKPDPVQLLLELFLILRREVLLYQVFMGYLQKNLKISTTSDLSVIVWHWCLFQMWCDKWT